MRATMLCAVLSLLSFLASSFMPEAMAFDTSYLPLNPTAISHRVPQKLIEESLQSGESTKFGKTTIYISENNYLQIHGSDNNSKPWSFVSHSWNGCASIWSADLDKNGTKDLIIMMHTGGCGWAPNSQLVVLMFEKNGRPFPWAVDGFFEIDKRGIKDLVDMDNDGHAELIRQSRDDGYWITSLYEAANTRWRKLENMDGVSFPLYTRFTQMPNHHAINLPAYRHPFESDLSNNCPNPSKSHKPNFLDEILWAKLELSENPCILFSDGRRSRPVSWYGSMAVVIDEPSSRRIALLSAPETAKQLLDEIARRRLPIACSGARQRGTRNLSSELILAQGKSVERTNQCAPNPVHNIDLALSNTELP